MVISSQKKALLEKGKMDLEGLIRDTPGSVVTSMLKSSNKKDTERILTAAGELTDSQVKSITDDKEIDNDLRNKFFGARSAQVVETLKKREGKATLAEVIGKADGADLKAIGFDKAYENAVNLTAKQIEDWKELTPTQKERLKSKRKNDLEGIFKSDPINGPKEIFEKRVTNDTERSKLSKDILTHPQSAQYMNKNVLTKILDNNKIDAASRADIKKYVLAWYEPGGPGASCST